MASCDPSGDSQVAATRRGRKASWAQMSDYDDVVIDAAILLNLADKAATEAKLQEGTVSSLSAQGQLRSLGRDSEAASTSQRMLQQHLNQVEREISSVAKIKGAQSLLAAKRDEKEQLLKQSEKGQGVAEPWRCVWCESLNFTHQCGHCRIKKSFGHGSKASKHKLRWLAQGQLERKGTW